MKLYKTKTGIIIESSGDYYASSANWDELINRDDLYAYVAGLVERMSPDANAGLRLESELLPPIGNQEVWASGVTYYKSREARMDESRDSGGGDFYDRVYSAERPELFMKAPSYRTVGPGQKVRIRKDSKWNVPEPELTLLISSNGKIIGYTIGNDMSSRDIEGENPLYLPQAKCYDGSASIGPCIFLSKEPIDSQTEITLEIKRSGVAVFRDSIKIDQIKRDFEELVRYLYMETSFPHGAMLMTGTGIVPPNEFTLEHGDEVRISIDHIGTLINKVG